jgi:hypothetical protein
MTQEISGVCRAWLPYARRPQIDAIFDENETAIGFFFVAMQVGTTQALKDDNDT